MSRLKLTRNLGRHHVIHVRQLEAVRAKVRLWHTNPTRRSCSKRTDIKMVSLNPV